MCHSTVCFTNIQYHGNENHRKRVKAPRKPRKSTKTQSTPQPRPATCMFIKIEKRLGCVLCIVYCVPKQNTTAIKPYQYHRERGINQTLKD